MMRTLIKKQLSELFFSLFKNRSNGKMQTSKTSLLLISGLLAFALLSFGASIFFRAYSMIEALAGTGYEWFAFTLFGSLAFGAGLLGSVFMAYSTLYAAKDNDLLISMPIKPYMILLARSLGLFILTAILEAAFLVPVWIAGVVLLGFDVWRLLLLLAALLLLPLFTFAFMAFFGWLIALIAPKVKNLTVLSAVTALLFVVLYMLIVFRFESWMQSIVADVGSAAAVAKIALFPMWSMGRGLAGEPLYFLFFALISLALFAGVYALLSRSFLRLATTSFKTVHRTYTGKQEKARGQTGALFKKEARRLFGCASYMLNTLFTVFFLLIAAVAQFFIDRQFLATVDGMLTVNGVRVFPLALAGAVSLLIGMASTTSCSIALEGRTLPILRSFPIDEKKILHAKLLLHIVFILLPTALCMAAFSVNLVKGIPEQILTFLLPLPVVYSGGVFGLIYNLRTPFLDWTNEAVAVKQSAAVLHTMLTMTAVVIVASAAALLMLLVFGCSLVATMCAALAIFLAVAVASTVLLEKWGPKQLSSL